jgi:hypothetical protein
MTVEALAELRERLVAMRAVRGRKIGGIRRRHGFARIHREESGYTVAA